MTVQSSEQSMLQCLPKCIFGTVLVPWLQNWGCCSQALQKESSGQCFIRRDHAVLSPKPGVSIALKSTGSIFVLVKKILTVNLDYCTYCACKDKIHKKPLSK